MRRIWLTMALGLLVLGGMAAPAAAQNKTEREPGVIDLGQLEVEGKVSKPQVFYVLGRSEFRYQGLKLKRSFVDRIVKSARTNPF